MSIVFKSLGLISLAAITAYGSIQILHPKDLKTQVGNDGYIKSGLGNFGHVLYGSSVLGRVFYPLNNTDACREYVREDLPEEFFTEEESDLTPLIIADRGNCSFVTKVRNIEKQGVKLAIIGDQKEEDSENLIMSDDGTGHSINIPSFIVRRKDADKIKAVVLKGQKVFIKAGLEMVNPDNRVEYEFWYSTILDIDFDKLVDIGMFQKALNKQALFTPRIYTYPCPQCEKEIKENNCLADGNYCPFFPQQALPPNLRDVKGRQFMEESLRQRCIYETISSQKVQVQNYTQWFNYVLKFIDDCDNAQSYEKDCSERVMRFVGLDIDTVDKCIASQFQQNGKVTTIKLLEEDREWAKKLGIVLHPSVTINNITYRGELEGFDIFKAICAGFLDQPDVCKGDKVFQILHEVNPNELIYRGKPSVRLFHIFFAIVVVLGLNFLALFIYRKYQKRKLNEELQVQVNSAVSQYFRLSGTETR